MIAYPFGPGLPSLSGIDLPPGMRGEEAPEADAAGKSEKRDRETEPAGVGGPQKAAGLQQIEGVVQNLSELRRRSRRAAKDAGSSPAPAAGERPLVHSSSDSGGMKAEGGLWTRNSPSSVSRQNFGTRCDAADAADGLRTFLELKRMVVMQGEARGCVGVCDWDVFIRREAFLAPFDLHCFARMTRHAQGVCACGNVVVPLARCTKLTVIL